MTRSNPNMNLDDLLGVSPNFEIERNGVDRQAEPSDSRASSDFKHIQALTADLRLLRERHAAEIKRWVDYDRRIKQWRGQIVRLVGWLKQQAEAKRLLELELQHQKNLVRLKDLEIERLRSQLSD